MSISNRVAEGQSTLRRVPPILAGRAWQLWVLPLLLLLPLLAYWPTITYEFGLRDDYSAVREAHEEPGTVLNFCASHARPIYGWLLEHSLRVPDTIHDLWWLRLSGVALVGGLSCLLFHELCAIGCPKKFSLVLSAWVGLLPAAQVIAAWAIGWPYPLTGVVALLAFTLMRRAFRDAENRPDWRWAMGAWALLVASTLIYQPNTFFFLVPLAAAVVWRSHGDPKVCWRWALWHLAVLAGALLAAFVVIHICYALDVFPKSDRIAFETDWLAKIGWFFREPLPNALSLFVLNDDHGRYRTAYLAGACIAGAIWLAGAWRAHRLGDAKYGWLWIAAGTGLPVLAFSISLIANEQFATYRTIYALTTVLLCFLLASLWHLSARVHRLGRSWGTALALVAAFVLARHHAYALLAVPQGNEWRLIEEGAEQVRLDERKPRIFVIEPSEADASTLSSYNDEFGSLSSNSDWTPKEMFRQAMHGLHPGIGHIEKRYEFASGMALPQGQSFDEVIDLRRLRKLRTDD